MITEQWLLKQREWIEKKRTELVERLTSEAIENGLLGPRDQLCFSLEVVSVAHVLSMNSDKVLEAHVEDFFTIKRFQGIGVSADIAVWTTKLISIEVRKHDEASQQPLTLNEFLEIYTHDNLEKKHGFKGSCIKAICQLLELHGLHLKHY